MPEMLAIGGLCGALAAAGAFRWVGRAILLLLVIGVLGSKVVVTVLVASLAVGIVLAILEALPVSLDG
ncbi:MAG: hypothetical protein OXN96_17360 [Bryobacterales bacterium]|nr:hypothetical protein [Bryobacterales bacterium]